MKTNFTKLYLCLMFICAVAFTNAQVANNTVAKNNNEEFHNQQVRKANELTEKIATTVKLTDEQKTKLQASMLEAMVKFNAAVLKAKKEDEARLPALNQELITDINSRLKTILTSEQFNVIMEKEQSN